MEWNHVFYNGETDTGRFHFTEIWCQYVRLFYHRFGKWGSCIAIWKVVSMNHGIKRFVKARKQYFKNYHLKFLAKKVAIWYKATDRLHRCRCATIHLLCIQFHLHLEPAIARNRSTIVCSCIDQWHQARLASDQ